MINGADVAALPPSLLMTAQGMHCRAGMLQHTLLHWAATHMSACWAVVSCVKEKFSEKVSWTMQ